MPQPERDGGNSSKRKSPGHQVNRHPGHLIRGETTGRSSQPRGTPEYLHKWKPPFQPRGNKSTLRKQGPQAETWGAGERKTYNFSIPCIAKSEDRHHRRDGEWPKKGGGTTVMTVPKARHRYQPEPSHNLQKKATLDSYN